MSLSLESFVCFTDSLFRLLSVGRADIEDAILNSIPALKFGSADDASYVLLFDLFDWLLSFGRSSATKQKKSP